MFKDRGSIKWVSLMLPEHVKMLRDWKEESQHDWKKPQLDEDQLDEMNRVLHEALAHNLMLDFTVIKNQEPEIFIGKIQSIDTVTQKVKIKQPNGQSILLNLQAIIKLERSD